MADCQFADGVRGEDILMHQAHLHQPVGLGAFFRPVLVALFLRKQDKLKIISLNIYYFPLKKIKFGNCNSWLQPVEKRNK